MAHAPKEDLCSLLFKVKGRGRREGVNESEWGNRGSGAVASRFLFDDADRMTPCPLRFVFNTDDYYYYYC